MRAFKTYKNQGKSDPARPLKQRLVDKRKCTSFWLVFGGSLDSFLIGWTEIITPWHCPNIRKQKVQKIFDIFISIASMRTRYSDEAIRISTKNYSKSWSFVSSRGQTRAPDSHPTVSQLQGFWNFEFWKLIDFEKKSLKFGQKNSYFRTFKSKI